MMPISVTTEESKWSAQISYSSSHSQRITSQNDASDESWIAIAIGCGVIIVIVVFVVGTVIVVIYFYVKILRLKIGMENMFMLNTCTVSIKKPNMSY